MELTFLSQHQRTPAAEKKSPHHSKSNKGFLSGDEHTHNKSSMGSLSFLTNCKVLLGLLALGAISNSGLLVSASDNSECDNNDDDEEVATWITDGGFFALFLGVCAMFWGLAAGTCMCCLVTPCFVDKYSCSAHTLVNILHNK
jgi:hypothetical protein